MAASPPSDRRDQDALERGAEDDRGGLEDGATHVLPGRSTLVSAEPPASGDTVVTLGGDGAARAPAEPPPSTGGGGPISVSLHSDESRFGSALDALRHDEIRRSSFLARFGLLLGAAVGIALIFLPGEPVMTAIAYGAVAVASIGNFWLHHLTSSPERYESRSLAIVWVMNSIAVSVGVIYFGVFSAAAIVVLLGVYFLALGQNLALAVICYVTCAGLRGAVTGMIVLGAIRDPGLIHTPFLSREVLLIFELLVQLILFAAFVMARASRRATLTAVTNYERVVRALALREALLHEARQDLERALQLGGVGRFTGQTIGSFRLGSVLGRGSMGEVYEAVRVATGEPAAVKLLQPSSMGNPSYLMRFLREVEVAATIEVPHVVRVLEVGNASAPIPYLAMERLRGRDLAQILREQRRLDAQEVIDLVDQAGRGISAAAAAGVVHRDLKPQNLFLAERPGAAPIWKVLDFGVSKLIGERGTLTQGQVVGTPVYMAPEQAQGLDVDQLADLYALAAIAYRCITGHLPYRAKDVPTIMYQVVYKMPIRPAALCDVPDDVDAVLLIAMAKNPSRRFASAAELTSALADGLRGRLSEELRARARELAIAHPWRVGP
jgi:eukaryotic-like serine/threonine-protein kinase